jgi:VanZ family protein
MMKKYVALTISLGLTALVFSFSMSSGSESSSLSSSIVVPIDQTLIRIFPDWTLTVDQLHLWVRKGAHVVEYAVLGVSWFVTLKWMNWPLIWFVLLGLAIAIIDETIQLFSLDRGSSVIDVLLYDMPGFLLVGWIAHRVLMIKMKRNAP